MDNNKATRLFIAIWPPKLSFTLLVGNYGSQRDFIEF